MKSMLDMMKGKQEGQGERLEAKKALLKDLRKLAMKMMAEDLDTKGEQPEGEAKVSLMVSKESPEMEGESEDKMDMEQSSESPDMEMLDSEKEHMDLGALESSGDEECNTPEEIDEKIQELMKKKAELMGKQS
jgi:hypothetical protein